MKFPRIAYRLFALTGCVATCAVTIPSTAWSCAPATLIGVWYGNGVMRRDATSPAEPARCRFRYSAAADKSAAGPGKTQRFAVDLDCRGIDVTFALAGKISVTPETGAVGGAMAGKRKGRLSITRRATGKVSGRCTGSGLRLNLRYRNWNTGNIDTPVMTARLTSQGALDIESRIKITGDDGKETGTAVLFKARFKRQKR